MVNQSPLSPLSVKVSIITPAYNSAATLRDTISSVLAQTYPEIEYIVVDGASTDGTRAILEEYKDRISRVISEPDRGLYDAMNKGIRAATGDIVGILNSDDFFTSPDIIETIVGVFEKELVDAVYGDVHFVRPADLGKCVRYYSSAIFRPFLFRFGFMPAHPSFYVRRQCYERFGLYALNYRIAADFELLLRFLYLHKITCKYLKRDVVTMRTGGVSTRNIRSRICLNKEIVTACRAHGIYTHVLLVWLKYFYKIVEIRN